MKCRYDDCQHEVAGEDEQVTCSLCRADLGLLPIKKFSVRVVHSGSDPLGGPIPEDHAFFRGLTVHHTGKDYSELEPTEGGCIREACTADGRYEENGKIHKVRYSVTRIE